MCPYQARQAKYFSECLQYFRSRKRRGSETMSEEEERSSGDEASRQLQRRGRRSGQRLRKEGRRRGEECDKSVGFISDRKMFQLGRSRSPVIMTECTAAMVLMDLSCPANRGRMSHASGHSGRTSFINILKLNGKYSVKLNIIFEHYCAW